MNSREALQQLLKKYHPNKHLESLNKRLITFIKNKDIPKIINTYKMAIPIIEQEMWNEGVTDTALQAYQNLFHELENLYASHSQADKRHSFIITIPVADRPQHLKECLGSIFTLCEKFNYGGQHNGVFKKIRVLVADDSKQKENIKTHIEISEYYLDKGLNVIYFGQQQQQQITSQSTQHNVEKIIGNFDISNFHHKGASITRNISYLKLQQLQREGEKTLFYFIDSDQEFQINRQTADGNKEKYAVNYFYYLDQIFSTKPVSILTGKVVGDPPVSPAVMAGTFLQDIISFLRQVSNTKPDGICDFHHKHHQGSNDASYHDMPELFGFKKKTAAPLYPCPIKGLHTNAQCFEYFSRQINNFFDGEHPTRKSYYQYENTLDSVKPARTIYTGNYIFKPKNLKYFIPFASLKLRMAGPVLGRILQSELGDEFVCANLPMLHKRTVDATGQSEFRPGVNHKKTNIDLSGEFHRQFFGDVMLFSIIKLCEIGYPKKSLSINEITPVVRNIINEMQKKYMHTQIDIEHKITQLKISLDSKVINKLLSASQKSKKNFFLFTRNIEFNFNNNAEIYSAINSNDVIHKNTKTISDAIFAYNAEQSNWEKRLSAGQVD